MNRAGQIIVLTAILSAAGGCQPPRPEAVPLDFAGATPRLDYSDLSFVLAACVGKNGELDVAKFKPVIGRLDSQLKLFAVTGPTATPQFFKSPEEQIAYWYNARAAWVMKLLSLADYPDVLPPIQLAERPFPLDGRELSLNDIDRILFQDPDWRTVAAAPSTAYERASLPREVFVADGIRDCIAMRISQFINDKRRFVIDVEDQIIYVPPMIWIFRDRLIKAHEEKYGVRGATLVTALLLYVREYSAVLRLQDALGYEVRPAPINHKMAVLRDD